MSQIYRHLRDQPFGGGLNGVGPTGLIGYRRVLRRHRPAHHRGIAGRTTKVNFIANEVIRGPILVPDFAGAARR